MHFTITVVKRGGHFCTGVEPRFQFEIDGAKQAEKKGGKWTVQNHQK